VKRHGRAPQINTIPGQEFALKATLRKLLPPPEPELEPPPVAGECVCDVTGIFWEAGDIFLNDPGNYSKTSQILLGGAGFEDNMPKAALVGNTCPGADLSGITASWSGGPKPPKYEIVTIDQVWALVVTEMFDDGTGEGGGTLTVSGSIVCGEETINVGSITLQLLFEGPGEG